MRAIVSATGYVNVIMVLNMKRFIAGVSDEHDRFEAVRGTSDFADAIKQEWGPRPSRRGIFSIADEVKQDHSTGDQMTTEQVGYSTGLFRAFILEQQTFPTYIVNKQKVEFPEYLLKNYQFSKLFLDAWEKWEIFIRPVYTGLFIIRLLHKYPSPESLLNIAKDVNHLQESFDIPSAFSWLQKILQDRNMDENSRQDKEQSIRKLLDWLGGDSDEAKRLQYLPVQPRLAMEVASLFVEEIATGIPVPRQPRIHLTRPVPRRSIPLHDSYVVYHIDKTFVNRSIKQKGPGEDVSPEASRPQRSLPDTLEEISVEDIKASFPVQQQLCNLMEGAVLKPATPKSRQSETGTSGEEGFPALRAERVSRIMETDLASWEDELCLMMARSAIFMPSKKFRNHQLLLTTLSRSTSHFKYVRYWGAIERMVELVLSVSVLAQLLERLSYSLLGRIAAEMHQIRSELLNGDIKMDSGRLSGLLSEAANLQRLASLCQGLGDPHVWSRAEYGIAKAQRLIDELGVLLALDHVQRNLAAINQLGDHIDELYLGDLAEKNNNVSTWSSLGLAAVSLTLTVLILPSFWADIKQIGATLPPALLSWLDTIESFGNSLAGTLITVAPILIVISIIQIMRTRRRGNFLRKRSKLPPL